MPTIQSTNSSSISSSDGSSGEHAGGSSSRRARSAGIAQTNQSASMRRRRPRRSRAPRRLRSGRRATSSDVDRVADAEAHAELAQVRDPRVDPGLVGRRVEHAVERAVVAAAHDVHDERLGHVADRAGAGHGLLGGDERARQARAR